MDEEVLRNLRIGDKLSIHWQDEDKFFDGRIVDIRADPEPRRGKRRGLEFQVRYDDGDIRWHAPWDEQWRRVQPEVFEQERIDLTNSRRNRVPSSWFTEREEGECMICLSA